MKEWTKIFKALGNESRLKIIRLLYPRKEYNVTEITDKIRISYKGTSQHLAHLARMNILESRGIFGKVLYYISPSMQKEVRAIVEKFLKSAKH